ncbi:MAG: SMI1/KNR4 family protein [Pseudomonadota bacterium]
MKKIIEMISDEWFREPPANANNITEVEKILGIRFPIDYVEFLEWSNGGQAKLGSAYFSFWPIQELIESNSAYSVPKYMTNKFIGIGTDGGDNLYALDFTKSDIPNFSIVPLGDLDPESKFTISPNLSEGIQKALNGEFDDSDYGTHPEVILSDEIIAIKMINIRCKADEAWQKKEYRKYIDLLDGVKDRLTEVELKKLNFAKSRK